MKREISRLEIKEGIHLQGLGIITSVLPMAMKEIRIKMFYDTTYPNMVLVEDKQNTHFIALSNVKSGTFGEVDLRKTV